MPEQSAKKKTDRILEEVQKHIEEKKIVDVEEKKVKLVIFKLGNEYYAFLGDDVKKVLLHKEITYVPGSPAFIRGIISVSGDIESVLNIHKFLGLPETQITKNTRIVLASDGNIRSGVMVDSVEEVTDIPKSAIESPLSTFDETIKQYITGEVMYNHKHITVFDIGEIFKNITA